MHIYTYIYKCSYTRQTTQSAQIPQKQDEHSIYVIMKTMCPPGYHHNGFVCTWTHDLYIYIYRYKDIHIYIYIYIFILDMRFDR